MTYLCIIFVSPAYFLTRQKWGGFILNSVFYGLAVLCLLSIIGAFIAPLFWILAVGHASFAYRKELMHEHATAIATEMAKKMKESEKPPVMR